MKKENKAIKNRIIRDIRNLFEYEEDYYKPVMKVTMIKIKHYQLNNISTKLDRS